MIGLYILVAILALLGLCFGFLERLDKASNRRSEVVLEHSRIEATKEVNKE